MGGCGYLEHRAILAELHLSGDTASVAGCNEMKSGETTILDFALLHQGYKIHAGDERKFADESKRCAVGRKSKTPSAE